MEDVTYKCFIIILCLLAKFADCVHFKECYGDTECEDTVEYTGFSFYSSHAVSYAYKCFNPARNSSPEVNGENVEITNFKPKSSWFGAYIWDMHGAALSPLFVAHRNLSCTEYLLSRVEKDTRLAMEMKHYSDNKVDYRFDFNQTGWIQYNKRYGCAKESLQVNNTRILDTDYESYIIMFSCAESHTNVGFHKAGYLLLIASEANVSELLWQRLQAKFRGFESYESSDYSLPDRTTLLQDRDSSCKSHKVLQNKNVLCPREILRSLLVVQREVILELRRKKQGKHNNKNTIFGSDGAMAYDKKEQVVDQIHMAEISCFAAMSISMALSLYWSHFSI